MKIFIRMLMIGSIMVLPFVVLGLTFLHEYLVKTLAIDPEVAGTGCIVSGLLCGATTVAVLILLGDTMVDIKKNENK